LAPLSFAAGDFGGERIELWQPECAEPAEPLVDFAQPRRFDGMDATSAIRTPDKSPLC
jgi:hypothetical protein